MNLSDSACPAREQSALALICCACTDCVSSARPSPRLMCRRLQDNVYLAERDIIAAAQARCDARHRSCGTELDDLRRRGDLSEGQAAQGTDTVPNEYADVRDRIEDVRSARAAMWQPRHPRRPQPGGDGLIVHRSSAAQPRPLDVDVGSGDRDIHQIDDDERRRGASRHRARRSAAEHPQLGHRAGRGSLRGARRWPTSSSTADVVIPAGSIMRGVVTSVEPGTRTNRNVRR